MQKKIKKVYQFKITLLDSNPVIWRKIAVPETYTFWDLHVAIQDAMGWEDCHLHEYKIRNPLNNIECEIGYPDDEYRAGEVLKGWEQPIKKFFTEKNNKALYQYDFGDDWHHEIKLEKITDKIEGKKYPLCLAGERACPPEDCGGIWGYENLLKVMSDPSHEEYEEMKEWIGEDFDPAKFDIKKVRFTNPQARLKMRLD
ncbi:MAG: hypothetical protein B6I30_10185 [Desulfobacteraceae bacterium 4572_187]|nr:MAG: hypothetical protein B6I30_10185 [Desulfobacteraceae bacterium 4572_187]